LSGGCRERPGHESQTNGLHGYLHRSTATSTARQLPPPLGSLESAASCNHLMYVVLSNLRNAKWRRTRGLMETDALGPRQDALISEA